MHARWWTCFLSRDTLRSPLGGSLSSRRRRGQRCVGAAQRVAASPSFTAHAWRRPQVELAQATMWDMMAPRSEREHLRNVFRGGKGQAEKEYNARLHGACGSRYMTSARPLASTPRYLPSPADWAHKFPFSKNGTLAIAWAGVNLAREEGLFYRPNISGLLARPLVNDFY